MVSRISMDLMDCHVFNGFPFIFSVSTDLVHLISIGEMDFNGCYESKLTATDTNIGNASSSIGNTRPHIGNKRSHIGDIRPHIGNIRPHFANTRPHIEHTRSPHRKHTLSHRKPTHSRLDFHGFLGFHAIHEWPWDHAFP